MVEEFFFMEPERVRCVKVKLPVVLFEEEVQIVIDNTTCLPELAKKIERIDAFVRDVEVEPLFIYERPTKDDLYFYENSHYYFEDHTYKQRAVKVKNLVVHGTLHKQIYYVNKENDVRHFAEDIPFTKSIDMDEKFLIFDEDDVYSAFKRVIINMHWDLVKASRLHQTGQVSFKVKLVEDRQIFVQVCPDPKGKCPRVNLLKDPGFESWSDPLVPVFWGGSNISRSTEAYEGQFAVEIGRFAPADTGSVFQTVNRNIHRGQNYKLTFWARENVQLAGASLFSLSADIVLYDESGMEIDTTTKSFSAADIPNGSYKTFSVETGKVPDEATTALIRFTFNPETGNTNAVKIDDVNFSCQP